MIKAALAKIASGLLTGIGFGIAIGVAMYGVYRWQMSEMKVQFKPYTPESGLVIENHRPQKAGSNTAFIGSIKNTGTTDWQGVFLEAELFDKDSHFIDKCSGYENGVLGPGQSRNFKISCGGCQDASAAPYDHYTIVIKNASPSIAEKF